MGKAFASLLGLPSSTSEKTDRQFVTALGRGLEILRVFEPQDGPLGNQELAERTGLPKPTVSRITHTLTVLGYLEYVPRLSKYRIGLGVLALGHACIGGAVLRTTAHPHMRRLATETDATVALGGRDRLSMIYLDVCRGGQTAALSLDAGARVPIYKTAMGYAYLWGLPEAERDLLMRAIAKSTKDEWSAIKKRLDVAFKSMQRHGFCIAEGTYERTLSGIGTALILQNGTEVYAFSCSGPAFRFTSKHLQENIGPKLVSMSYAVREEVSRQTRPF